MCHLKKSSQSHSCKHPAGSSKRNSSICYSSYYVGTNYEKEAEKLLNQAKEQQNRVHRYALKFSLKELHAEASKANVEFSVKQEEVIKRYIESHGPVFTDGSSMVINCASKANENSEYARDSGMFI